MKVAHRQGQKWVSEVVDRGGSQSSLQIDHGLIWVTFGDDAGEGLEVCPNSRPWREWPRRARRKQVPLIKQAKHCIISNSKSSCGLSEQWPREAIAGAGGGSYQVVGFRFPLPGRWFRMPDRSTPQQ